MQTAIPFPFSFWPSSLLFLYIMHLAQNQRLVICSSCLQSAQSSDVSRTWYPPLEKTISCLSKLYRCLEPAVFTGLAQVLVFSIFRLLGLSIFWLLTSFTFYFFFISGSCRSLRVIHSGERLKVHVYCLFRRGRAKTPLKSFYKKHLMLELN